MKFICNFFPFLSSIIFALIYTYTIITLFFSLIELYCIVELFRFVYFFGNFFVCVWTFIVRSNITYYTLNPPNFTSFFPVLSSSSFFLLPKWTEFNNKSLNSGVSSNKNFFFCKKKSQLQYTKAYKSLFSLWIWFTRARTYTFVKMWIEIEIWCVSYEIESKK